MKEYVLAIEKQFHEMEQKSETRLRYQSELSNWGGGSFRLQSLIGLVINGTKNQISDRKILI